LKNQLSRVRAWESLGPGGGGEGNKTISDYLSKERRARKTTISDFQVFFWRRRNYCVFVCGVIKSARCALVVAALFSICFSSDQKVTEHFALWNVAVGSNFPPAKKKFCDRLSGQSLRFVFPFHGSSCMRRERKSFAVRGKQSTSRAISFVLSL
jgi:hypothetical protein